MEKKVEEERGGGRERERGREKKGREGGEKYKGQMEKPSTFFPGQDKQKAETNSQVDSEGT